MTQFRPRIKPINLGFQTPIGCAICYATDACYSDIKYITHASVKTKHSVETFVFQLCICQQRKYFHTCNFFIFLKIVITILFVILKLKHRIIILKCYNNISVAILVFHNKQFTYLPQEQKQILDVKYLALFSSCFHFLCKEYISALLLYTGNLPIIWLT